MRRLAFGRSRQIVSSSACKYGASTNKTRLPGCRTVWPKMLAAADCLALRFCAARNSLFSCVGVQFVLGICKYHARTWNGPCLCGRCTFWTSNEAQIHLVAHDLKQRGSANIVDHIWQTISYEPTIHSTLTIPCWGFSIWLLLFLYCATTLLPTSRIIFSCVRVCVMEPNVNIIHITKAHKR